MIARLLLGLAFVCCFANVGLGQENSPALAKYVAQPDDSYSWAVRRSGKLANAQYAELLLTSQTWRDIPWRHQLFVIKPADMRPQTDHALLFITGGRWRPELDDLSHQGSMPREALTIASLAEKMRTPVAVLLQVPHQPIFDGKYEDQIIAYTFKEHLESGDEDWPLLLPMVKSAVRAMDATQEHCRQAWSLEVETFTVAGASKRGWTTWLVGAVDQRAAALAPMVIDVLNMSEQMTHQLESWGNYSYQIDDYTRLNLPQQLQTKAGQRLRRIVDPYAYRDALKQPKLIIIGTNDHYWPLDALNLYWEGLAGEKHILYLPNNGHGMEDRSRVAAALAALHRQAAAGAALPKLTWQYEADEKGLTLQVASDPRPKAVRIWTARSATRDFRQSQWSPAAAKFAAGKFVGALPKPSDGYAAMFAEAVFPSEAGEFALSTTLRILPAMREATAPGGE